jgi:hypothetical protein
MVVMNWLLVLKRRTIYMATEEIKIIVMINSRLLPIKMPLKRVMDIVPINPILASKRIVSNMAATLMGIKYSDNSNRKTKSSVKPMMIAKINEISKTSFQ